VKTGKSSDGDQWVKETARASKVSEELMTNIEDVVFVVHREVDMLTEIERRQKRQTLKGESVCRIVEINVKVASDDEFMRCGCSEGQKRTEVIKEDKEWFRKSGRRRRMVEED